MKSRLSFQASLLLLFSLSALSTLVRGSLGTDTPDPTLESASPSASSGADLASK